MQEDSYHRVEGVYRAQFQKMMVEVRRKMGEALLHLESDEALRHLAGNVSLVEFKEERVEEILRETFEFSETMGEMAVEVSRLKSEYLQLQTQQTMRERDQLSVIEEVERRFEEYRREV